VSADGSTLRRVAKNTAVPTATSFVNKALDLVFAIILARSLGPTELGRYTWVVLVVGYFDILINFGLGILIARQVARDAASATRYMGAALVARATLWILSLALALLIAGPLAGSLGITTEMGVALAVFTVGIGVSNLAGICSAVFNGRELMEYPALVTVLTSVLKLGLGATVLLMGYGIIAVAFVSIAVNVVSGAVLVGLVLAVLGRVRPTPSAGFAVELGRSSYPLMINNLLATVFFRVDGLILRASAGDAVLGWYGMAYKFIDGLAILPTNVTLALFPILSRLAVDASPAEGDGDGRHATLARTTRLALKALLALAFPIAVGTTLLADPIIRALAGEAYLPHSAIALQILIWFVPFSFTNGLLQYVLIALDQQRFITKAFLAATILNIAANLLVIPQLSYLGAALTTILSELVLLIAFGHTVRKRIGPIGLVDLVWRPAVAAAAMAPLVWLLRAQPALAIPAAAFLYVMLFIGLGGITRSERAIVLAAIRSVRSDRANNLNLDTHAAGD
jgi:O-antigen/teichoic acid export membrane protein